MLEDRSFNATDASNNINVPRPHRHASQRAHTHCRCPSHYACAWFGDKLLFFTEGNTFTAMSRYMPRCPLGLAILRIVSSCAHLLLHTIVIICHFDLTQLHSGSVTTESRGVSCGSLTTEELHAVARSALPFNVLVW
jgi:hypothetical protein